MCVAIVPDITFHLTSAADEVKHLPTDPFGNSGQ